MNVEDTGSIKKRKFGAGNRAIYNGLEQRRLPEEIFSSKLRN
jgi:hypothetical protein